MTTTTLDIDAIATELYDAAGDPGEWACFSREEISLLTFASDPDVVEEIADAVADLYSDDTGRDAVIVDTAHDARRMRDGWELAFDALADAEAVITGRGSDSTVPSHEGAVDADIVFAGHKLCSVTLLPRESDGVLDIWGGSIDMWCDDPSVFDSPYDSGHRERGALIASVVAAVRAAV